MTQRTKAISVLCASLLWPSEAVAEPDAARSIGVGAAVEVATFVSGVALLGASDNATGKAGWLAIGGGLTLAPLLAHAVSGEWKRGFLFSAIPAACWLGTSAFIGQTNRIDSVPLREQRVYWAFFSVGLAASVVGVIDAAFVETRNEKGRDGAIASAPKVIPSVSANFGGVSIVGQF